ncbi:MAG: tyrosine-protein phosphatase [Desulfobulbaceae bacterium]|nr:tyrosine-protein phosphatase [Desulfobulbaceae bacterium]
MNKYILLLLLLIPTLGYANPRLRPDTWAKPIIGTHLQNLYLVDEGVYRSKQPEDDDISNLKMLGIREIINLREFHSDKDNLTDKSFTLHRIKIHTSDITEEQIITALRIIKNRKGPVLIHCWHGSDRTGVTIAAYRIIFNHWSKKEALDEMINGGYGYHAKTYPELVKLVENLNIDKMKNSLNLQ